MSTLIDTRSEVERLEETLTRVDPDWCERWSYDVQPAANFYKRFAPEEWEQAAKEIG